MEHANLLCVLPARQVGVVLFDGFELLDVAGPLELFGKRLDLFSIELTAESAGPVASAQGPALVADVDFDTAATPEVALVPGGIGTRTLVEDGPFLNWLSAWAETAEFITSICTGAGLLDGYRATTNKRAFDWSRSQGSRVEWIAEARWV